MSGGFDCWTKEDKERLLLMLKKYSPDKISKIKKAFPQKSLQEVKDFIEDISTAAKYVCSQRSCIKDWLASEAVQKDDTDWMLTKALLFIQLFEKHPEPDDSNPFDLREIYKFLHMVAGSGQPPVLSPADQELVRLVHGAVVKQTGPVERDEILSNLGGLLKKKEIKRTYSRRDK